MEVFSPFYIRGIFILFCSEILGICRARFGFGKPAIFENGERNLAIEVRKPGEIFQAPFSGFFFLFGAWKWELDVMDARSLIFTNA